MSNRQAARRIPFPEGRLESRKRLRRCVKLSSFPDQIQGRRGRKLIIRFLVTRDAKRRKAVSKLIDGERAVMTALKPRSLPCIVAIEQGLISLLVE